MLISMERDIYHQLIQWKASLHRKPLILEGARQVGKTYALQYFGNSAYENFAYVNFEKDSRLSAYFEADLDPKRLIKVLALHTHVDILPQKTLLIFDEIQECPRALTSLKYFCEEKNEFHLVAAGSLLGIKTANTSGFPVGKVNFLKLFPLTFFEFLQAVGEKRLREFIETDINFEPIPEPLHDKLIDLLKSYFFVGGMPEAVTMYIENGRYEDARIVHHEIMDAYERDFAKHAPQNQFMKIITIWKNIHAQLAKENKKFIFSVIKKSARGRDFMEAIEWLVDAGLIVKCHHVSTPKIPLSAYKDDHIFKIYMLDIGLLAEQGAIAADTILKGNHLFSEFKGAFAENFVAQEFRAMGQKQLYYWSSPGTAEVDFIVEQNQQIFPLEVKSGTSQKKKSLLSYANKYNVDILSRASLMNLRQDGKVYNYPLYMIQLFLKLRARENSHQMNQDA